MEWLEDVEEARYFVEEVLKNDVDIKETGENIDPQIHQEDIECELQGTEEDDLYKHLDPEGLKGREIPDMGIWYRKLELMDKDELEQKTRKLDKWQRQVVDVAIIYVRKLKKYVRIFCQKCPVS